MDEIEIADSNKLKNSFGKRLRDNEDSIEIVKKMFKKSGNTVDKFIIQAKSISQLLVHSQICNGCRSNNCLQIRSYVLHKSNKCSNKDSCIMCKRLNNITKIHTITCEDLNCTIEECVKRIVV